MKNSVLLIIDMQNDFVREDGALAVKGAIDDSHNISEFIKEHTNNINSIMLTMDSHHPQHLSHPIWWVDENGQHPEPFTEITVDDLKNKKYISPYIDEKWAIEYFNITKRPQMIWPYHCLVGSEGAAIYNEILNSVTEWSKERGIMYNVIQKGMCPITEQYSVFKAAAPVPQDGSTCLNYRILTALSSFDEIYICGEAMNYCVRESIKTLIEDAPDLLKKVIILKDCMSSIGDFNIEEDEVYKQAVALGAAIKTSKEI